MNLTVNIEKDKNETVIDAPHVNNLCAAMSGNPIFIGVLRILVK